MYLFYFLLAGLMFFGAKCADRGKWNEEYTSLKQTKILRGMMALGVVLHHMAQKTCAPWQPQMYIVHGLDPFVPIGYLFVSVFLFCSGLGLYRSFKSKPGYLQGFCGRRILPLVIAFYLSEAFYTAIRLAMGEKMNILTIIWYLSGLHMANTNAWYVIVICFFYFAFWASFRFGRSERMAIVLVFLFTFAYTILGSLIDHQNDWWMSGEWWYNSIILFPLGLLFGKYEKRITAILKKVYPLWLVLSIAALFFLFRQSEWLNSNAWGYYGEWGDPLKVQHRLMSAGLQWMVAISFTAVCFLLMMKVEFGNAALASLGRVTLEFYLMHGIFVELFGYNFLGIAKSKLYIRNVPLYILAVLTCSVSLTLLFSLIWKQSVNLVRRIKPKKTDGYSVQGVCENHKGKLNSEEKKRKIKRFLIPGTAILFLTVVFLFLFSSGNEHVRVMSGMEFHIPEGFSRKYTDSRYAVWEYTGKNKRPGRLILDADIRDDKAKNFSTTEEVLENCDWLTEAELYINPQGVRMIRGFADYSGRPERRYYIESKGTILLMCMLEDERFYSCDDCEEAMLQTANSIRPVN